MMHYKVMQKMKKVTIADIRSTATMLDTDFTEKRPAKSIKAVFLVTNDLRPIVSRITTSLCLSMNKVIPGCAVAAQDLNHIWRLYVNKNDARGNLFLGRL